MDDLTTGIWPNYGARTTIRECNSELLAPDATLHRKVGPSVGRGVFSKAKLVRGLI